MIYRVAKVIADHKWLFIAFMSIAWLILTDEERDEFSKWLKERAK